VCEELVEKLEVNENQAAMAPAVPATAPGIARGRIKLHGIAWSCMIPP
jgi:hypothetical protein